LDTVSPMTLLRHTFPAPSRRSGHFGEESSFMKGEAPKISSLKIFVNEKSYPPSEKDAKMRLWANIHTF
jgi:hypothetical protein